MEGQTANLTAVMADQLVRLIVLWGLQAIVQAVIFGAAASVVWWISKKR
jgi:hypothetical protein